MKKSSIAIAITVLIITILGALYINNSYNLKKISSSGESKIEDLNKADDSKTEDTVFGEYKHSISGDDTIVVSYLRSGDTNKIYALNPVESKDRYYISQNGSIALYVGKDNHIWALYSNGTIQKMTPDKYENIDKNDITKANPGYIWAASPELTPAGNIRFISNLPDVSDVPQKSIWEINLQDESMKKVYSPSAGDFKILGYREDGNLLILDGDNIAAIDDASTIVDNIDVKDKYIMNISRDGTKIMYVNKENGLVDFSRQYIMNSIDRKYRVLPGIEGYIAMDIGSWSSDSSRYAFAAKSISGNRYKIAVVSFEEDFIDINSVDPAVDISFNKNCSIKWTDNSQISIDIGDDVISVELN